MSSVCNNFQLTIRGVELVSLSFYMAIKQIFNYFVVMNVWNVLWLIFTMTNFSFTNPNQ